MGHSLLSPSAAKKWMSCPGSILMEKDKAETASKYADEGTLAHELAAACLKNNANPISYSLCDEYPDGMREYVAEYTSAVQSQAENADKFMVEREIELSDILGVPNTVGTADAIIYHAARKELQVHDLKYGRGVAVSAVDNPQLKLYAAGAFNEIGLLEDIECIRMFIHQVRTSPVSEFVISRQDLETFIVEAKGAAQKAYSIYQAGKCDDIDLVPSESACMWCEAKVDCPKLSKKIAQAVSQDFEDLTAESAQDVLKSEIENFTAYDTTRLAECLKVRELVQMWLDDVIRRAFAELSNGNSIDGFKLVPGRAGNRKWSDEAAVEDLLKRMRLKQEDMYSFKLITPTKAQKMLSGRRWSSIEKFITRPEPKPILVSADDPRPAIVGAVGDDFTNLDGGGNDATN